MIFGLKYKLNFIFEFIWWFCLFLVFNMVFFFVNKMVDWFKSEKCKLYIVYISLNLIFLENEFVLE